MHCSPAQQQRVAQIFRQHLKGSLFTNDTGEFSRAQLSSISPSQLLRRVLLKGKIAPLVTSQSALKPSTKRSTGSSRGITSIFVRSSRTTNADKVTGTDRAASPTIRHEAAQTALETISSDEKIEASPETARDGQSASVEPGRDGPSASVESGREGPSASVESAPEIESPAMVESAATV
eukprot:1104415-Prymnesium_polylepis.1